MLKSQTFIYVFSKSKKNSNVVNVETFRILQKGQKIYIFLKKHICLQYLMLRL